MLAIVLPDSLGPYAVLLAIGFLVGLYGHGARSNWIIAFGIVVILAAIGLLSFAALAQLAPAFFGGLFWREGTARGAMTGMLVGFAVWAYTLFIPSFLEGSTAGLMLLQHGPFGIEALRPRALFGADLPPLMHGVLWSLSLNILTYIVMSLAQRPSSIERLQADLFVPSALTPHWTVTVPNPGWISPRKETLQRPTT